MISLRKLTKHYGGLPALQELDLEVQRGDCFGLIGPNGAGKTTLIRILSTLLEPSDGLAYVDGKEVSEDPVGASSVIGYLPDTFPIYGDLRVWEFLEYYAGCYRVPRRRRMERVEGILDLVDLRGKRDEYARNLSRGMRQRLCLGKTLIHDPKLLLLDEPTSGLDPKARIEFRQLMRELVRLGKTVLISSHVLPELSEFCNSVGIMERGRMVLSGRVDEILARMKPHRTLVLEFLAGEELLLARLQAGGIPGARAWTVEGKKLTVDFDGKDEQLADFHHAVAAQPGVRLLTFTEQRSNLEDIFLKVAAHEVS